MIKNEKMSLHKLLKSVNDNEDYDYLVKAISSSSGKKSSKKFDEETIVKENISFFHDKYKEG